MEVFLYQFGILIAIQIAAMFGKNSRNTAVVLISLFTILQVFMSWLLLLQFITIYISYNISNNLYFKNNQAPKSQKTVLKSYENGARVYREYDENDDLSPEIRKKIKSQKEINKISKDMYKNNAEYKKSVDDVMNEMFKNINKK